MFNHRTRIFLLLLVSLVLTAGGKDEAAQAVASDIPYIKCQVCKEIVKQSLRVKGKLDAELKPGKRLSEGDLLEKLEKLCAVDATDGEWLSHFDLVEEGSELQVIDKQQIGTCGSECRTIALACDQITYSADLSDLSEMLYVRRDPAKIADWLCNKTTKVCRTEPPPLPEGRPKGPAFKRVNAEELQRLRTMRNMKDSGMRGKMYDKDMLKREIEEMKEMGYDMDGIMDDDEEEEEPSQSADDDRIWDEENSRYFVETPVEDLYIRDTEEL